MREKPLVVGIVGPTAVGKTKTAIALAKKLSGEIISADSKGFYKQLNIGTAKPTIDERAEVVHHLVDVTDLEQVWSIGVFKQAAEKTISAIIERGNVPILVGGSGQYIWATVEGWSIPTQKPDQKMRAVLNTLAKEAGSAWLYSKLELMDPQAAAIIDYRNTRRTIRALEVIFKTGNRFSEQRNKKPPFFDSILIGLDLPRDELYARVDARIEEMIRMGLVDEVQELVEMGYEQQLSKVAAIGYGELLGYLKGDYDLEEAIRLIKRNTRIFIRRQGNWFKKTDPRIKWFNAEVHVVTEISDYLQTQLKTARN